MKLKIHRPEKRDKAYRVVMTSTEKAKLEDIANRYDVNASEAIRSMINTFYESMTRDDKPTVVNRVTVREA